MKIIQVYANKKKEKGETPLDQEAWVSRYYNRTVHDYNTKDTKNNMINGTTDAIMDWLFS